jgi:hypothetical protein
MRLFRPIKGGGASVWLSADEAALLRALVVPVMELLNDPARPAPAASEPAESADLFDDLEKMFNETTATPPDAPADPVLARLLASSASTRSRRCARPRSTSRRRCLTRSRPRAAG